MSVIKKPDLKIFAQDAKTGEVETFPDILRGWGVTLDRTAGKPPLEWFNAIGKRVDEWLMYLTQRGVAEWDTALSYPKTAIVQFNSVVYVSIKETKGEQPDKSQASWSTLGVFLGLDKYSTTAEMNLTLLKKIDKANITNQTGNSTELVVSQQLLTNELGKKQPKGDYATNEALNNGLNTKLNTSSVVQGTGTSTTQVISQNGVTNALNTKTDANIFQSKTASGNAVILPAGSPISFIFNKDGSFYLYSFDSGNKFKINKDGEVTDGIIPFPRITGAPLLGVNQKWKTVTKQINTLYTNTTQKPIFVFAKSNASSNNFKLELEVDGVIASSTMVNGSGGSGTVTKELSCGAIVPSQSSYKFLVGGVEPAGVSISYAAELS
ncbi:TPA: hypothetical protein ACS78C_000329 [Providencia alcalifaciens]